MTETMTLTQMLLLVCPMIFLASFVDSIAGGGGLISLPTYMMTGLPIHTAWGCNKFSACMSTIFASWNYYKSGKINMRVSLITAIFSLIGALIGTQLNLLIDSNTLKKIFVACLPFIAIVTLFGGKRKVEKPLMTGKKLWVCCVLIGFGIGLYDGLLGPGTGTFLILAFTMLVGFDHVTASGNAKIVNLASNAASMVTYLWAGRILFPLAIPAAVCGIAGGILGSKMAIKKGSGFIKIIVILVLIGIFVKMAWDLWGGA